MIALVEKPYKTCRERNQVYEKIIEALELCEEECHIALLMIEFKQEMKDIELFDNLTNTTPITEILNMAIEQHLENIKEKNHGSF